MTRTRLYLTAFLVGLAVLFGGASKAEPAPRCHTEVSFSAHTEGRLLLEDELPLTVTVRQGGKSETLRLVAFEEVGGVWIARYGANC